jgi:phosphopantetheinyl transferase (holo-ACP synthase)
VLIDALILCDQYYGQLTAVSTGSAGHSTSAIQNINTKLWGEIRSRGCQFLGPQMQEDVLKIVLHALDIMTRMSRKVLIMYVVYALKKTYQKASKTNVGHVIQILYRAGCFKKLEKNEPLMELKKEFSKYPALRKQHDMELIKVCISNHIPKFTNRQYRVNFEFYPFLKIYKKILQIAIFTSDILFCKEKTKILYRSALFLATCTKS